MLLVRTTRSEIEDRQETPKSLSAEPYSLGCIPRLTENVTNFSLALGGLIGGNRRVGVVYHCKSVGQVAEFKFELKFRVKFYAILESISKIIDC